MKQTFNNIRSDIKSRGSPRDRARRQKVAKFVVTPKLRWGNVVRARPYECSMNDWHSIHVFGLSTIRSSKSFGLSKIRPIVIRPIVIRPFKIRHFEPIPSFRASFVIHFSQVLELLFLVGKLRT